MILLIATLGLLVGLQAELTGLEAFQHHSRDRWESLYSQLFPELVKCNVEEDGTVKSFMIGFPEEGKTRMTHLQGSPIETQTDKVLIQSYIDGLKGDEPESVAFKVLEGWATEEFYRVLEDNGWFDVELSTVMTIANKTELIAPLRPFADGYTLSKVNNMKDLLEVGKMHGGSCEWILEKMDESVFEDPRLNFWRIIHNETGTLACSGLVEVVNGIGGLHMVETHKDHRRRGLASSLVYEAISKAIDSAELRSFVLGSSPEAVTVYSKLGFKPYGAYHSYDYLGVKPQDLSALRTKRPSDINR